MTVQQRTGREVGGTYQYVVTASLADLNTGETRVIGTYRKSAGPGPGTVVSSAASTSYVYGKFSASDVMEALEEGICPALRGFMRLNPES